MPDALIDILGVVPVQMVFAYALAKMLVIRRVGLYMMLELVVVLLVCFFRPSMGIGERFAASVVLYLVPFFMSEGSVPRRLFVILLANMLLFVLEVPGGVLWTAMTGSNIGDYDAVRANLGAYAFTHVVHLAMLVPMLVALIHILRRLEDRGGRSAWVPALFTLVQVVLVNFAIMIPLWFVKDSLEYYAIVFPLSILCLAADALLLVVMGRFSQKRYDDERAAMLEQRLSAYLAQYGSVVEDIERIAKMRHDRGNQLQVVFALLERGQLQEARRHLALMEADLVGSENGGGASA